MSNRKGSYIGWIWALRRGLESNLPDPELLNSTRGAFTGFKVQGLVNPNVGALRIRIEFWGFLVEL